MKVGHDYRRVLDIEASLTDMQQRSERRAWHIAYAAVGVAVLSSTALAVMVPFYRVVPLPIEVDRLTGESQVIDVLDATHVHTKEIQDKHWVEVYVREQPLGRARVRELFIRHIENCVHLVYNKGGHGQARVTPAELIASTMRMRPDRVLLAELRGAEAYDFLKLLTTGHSGSITSYHASSAAVAIERFALMAREHPEAAAYDDAALKRLLFLTIDVVAHMEAQPVFDDAGVQTGKRWSMTEVWFDPVRKYRTEFE